MNDLYERYEENGLIPEPVTALCNCDMIVTLNATANAGVIASIRQWK